MTALDFVLLALACNRWTRLVVADRLTSHWRMALADWAYEHDGPIGGDNAQPWRTKLSYLIQCPHCFGVWAAIFVVGIWYYCPPWGLAWVGFVVIPAVANVTSLIAITLGHLED